MTFVLLYLLALFSASFFATLAAPSSSTALPSPSPSVSVALSLNDQLPMVARVNQPYSWAFSPGTFYSTDGTLSYTTSSLPTWLTFDADVQTFHGTPTANDTGYPEITVTAHATGSSTSSRFTICVTDNPAPTLNRPVAEQFTANSSSLSSIFFLRQSSALMSNAADAPPTLRVPPKWSFSIGLESDTFVDPAGRDVFYELRLANGSCIPDYLTFDSKTITLDGVVPPSDEVQQPLMLSFNLHASDQEGYTAAKIPFSVVLADHELSMTNPLPTINVTAGNDFVVSLLSAADFTGILVDGDNIQPSNISSMDIDVSNYSWLHYDRPSRTLSGTPGNSSGSGPVLSVNLTTIFDQSIQTQVSLAVVEPYFITPSLPAINTPKGDDISMTLSNFFSPSAADPNSNETTVSVTFSPITAANFMRYDPISTKLFGTIPSDYDSAVDHITAAFTAYSHITHSTSHTVQEIYVPGTGNTKSLAPSYPSGLATEAHRKLVLGLVLAFGTIGMLCLLTGIFALVRRCARVPDTAVVGEQGQIAWSEKDRRWYGLTLSPGKTRVVERGTVATPSQQQMPPTHPSLGLGLHRVSERSQQEGYSQGGHPHHQRYDVDVGAVMSKKEFLSRIKETVRQVSDKYSASRRGRHPNQQQQQNQQGQQPTARLVIGKPILVASTRPMDIPGVQTSSLILGDESVLPLSRPTSTFLTGSPSASTGEHSIPRRRPDFGVPRNLAQVHFGDGLLVRQVSTGSMGGTSFQSGLSGEGESVADMSMGPPTKPRLVPFTPSTRVPIPQATAVPDPQGVPGFAGSRIASQRAKVCKVEGGEASADADELGATLKRSGTSDELSMGMHYVRSLGADQLTMRSSFASLESSGKSGGEEQVMKVLLRAGERFKFRVPMPAAERGKGGSSKGYYVKLMGGQALPKFIYPDLGGIGSKGVLELSGVPTPRDIGEVTVGVFADKDGACVASVIIEVVGKR
ncbi:hypothetical protein BDN70DRAFT_795672 [Pholiota conissans]|uniref:Dystroglycan-type cadherin-like domain-containing protein n=1 Tax=Pholiota conissans TaxID=109636 RepID=A0A9P6CZQ0_9AGAR|nr:hypothetical protein BDN70DRAFT_795672 [Pholiota conissans]